MIDIIKWCNENIIWGIPMMLLFTAVGLLFTVRLKALQIIRFPAAIKKLFSTCNDKKSTGSVTPLRALTASLGTTLGTGNIIAVGTAIAIGGAGAVFWMWIAAVIGMITCYAENYLAYLYRHKAEKSTVTVPFSYIQKAFGEKKAGRFAASFFAVCCIGASFGMGNMAQVNSAGAVISAGLNVPLWITGLICALMTAVLCGGNLKKLTDFTVKIIPAVSVLYIIGCLAVIVMNIERLPDIIYAIFTEAFSTEAILGGSGGTAMLLAMKWGLRRGIFSNEAGLGTSVIINSESTAKSAHSQGLFAMMQVFIDTIIMCSMTALCVLCSNADNIQTSDGIDMAFIAFDSGLGSFAGIFLAVTVLIFALSTVAGWFVYGKSCINYLTGGKWNKAYYWIFIILAFSGTVMHSDAVWEISDFFNGIMAIPNLLALIILRKEIKRN